MNLKQYKRHYGIILRLGTPIILGQLGNVVLGFIDTIMVGNYNANALASAGFVNNIFNLGIVALLGFSYCATPVIGAYYGRKEHDNVAGAFKDTIWANLLFGAIVIAAYILLYLNIGNLGQPQELLPTIRPYFLTLLLSLPTVIIFNSLKQFTDTVGATQTAMWIILITNFTNVILNYLLIFGAGGFPELGLTGAGIATLLSRILGLFIFVMLIARQKRFRIYKRAFKNHSTSRGGIKKLFIIGTPLSLQMGTETASFSLASLLMGWLGTVELAAFQILTITGSLCFMIYYGIGAAASIRISHYRGRNEWQSVGETANASLHIILIVAAVLSALIALLRNRLAGIFTDDADIQNMFAILIIPMLAYQISDGMQTNYANTLRGIQVTKPLSIYAFISYICLALPTSYILGFPCGLGAKGVAYGLPVGLTVAAILYYRRFNKEIHKQLAQKE